MIGRTLSAAAALILIFSIPASGADDTAKRKAYLDGIRTAIPHSGAWERWLNESGELPPDFDALPSRPELPDPLLRTVGGKEIRVTKPSEWPARRKELLELFHTWMLGTIPQAPDNLRAEILDEHAEGNAASRRVRLTFGPGGKASLTLELLIPQGKGPFPVFLTQDNHRAWALIALSRGYMACVYSGADSRDDTGTFADAYPGYDWSLLTKRAWAASRCVDYLYMLPQTDRTRIAITGHSRNGKQSLIAAALDERISLVISSSSGTGGAMPARLFSDRNFGESIEHITRVFPEWFHPRLRFFSGREQKLPFDMNELVALSAPRPCLLSIALNDFVESASAMEAMYLSIRPVWCLFGVGDNLRIMYRPGGHETDPAVIERYLDWCDLRFGRGGSPFPETLLFPHDWDTWNRTAAGAPSPLSFPVLSTEELITPKDRHASGLEGWKVQSSALRNAVAAMLGAAPPSVVNPGGAYGAEKPHMATLLGRLSPPKGVVKLQVVFGSYINADIYIPEGLAETGKKAPAVLWLHPFSTSGGYKAGYLPGGGGLDQPDTVRGEEFYQYLASRGYTVVCFDQIGHGSRIGEAEGFYRRHPRWSLMGKMVADARAALDMMEKQPYIDTGGMFIAGYGPGAMTALHLAALDNRPAGFALVSPPNPFRSVMASRETGGIRVWARDTMLLPALGRFEKMEERLPYDVNALFALAAPKPVLAITPKLDRHTLHVDITRAIASAAAVYSLYGASGELTQNSPDTFDTFGFGMHRTILEWLNKKTGRN